MAVQIALGLLIGMTLGLLGGGGSILTVPVLVYLVGYDARAAVTTSLAIVGISSLAGVGMHRSQGTLNVRVAAAFGGAGMATSFLAARLSQFFAPGALLIAFSLLMLLVGVFMLRSRAAGEVSVAPRGFASTLVAGAAVGILTGVLGVGGGFLIVPALVMLLGLPMRTAVGTSLLVIAMNSLAGFLGHLADGPPDLQLIATFATAGILGTFVGARLTRYISPDKLRLAFALFVIALGLFLLADNTAKLLR